jgi:inosine/xanthosine triphosphatase
MTMKKVIIASKNPVKIQAVKNGFGRMFPNLEFEYIAKALESGVSDQPMSDAETYLGANNRAKSAAHEFPYADFYIGIEGGIERLKNDMQAFAWIVVKSSEGKIGKSKTATFYLPQKIIDLICQGKELGEADDIVFGLENSKQENGAVGILTNNAISRTSYYTEAIVLALIPFLNDKLY